MVSNNIAIIPARGGSKRLPRKNILPLKGKPMIAWTIEAALNSGVFKDVYVSTEDQEIEEIAACYDVEVLRRPQELASDTASCAQVCAHHLRELAENGKSYKRLYCLYATAPLRNKDDILNIEDIFNQHPDCKGVIAVTDFTHYPFQAFERSKDNTIRSYWPELCRKKGSEFMPMVAGNGSTYAINVKDFQDIKDFYTPGMKGLYSYLMEQWRSIDIDTREDYEILRLFINHPIGHESQVNDEGVASR